MNYVNHHDVLDALAILGRRGFLISKLFSTRDRRVANHWDGVQVERQSLKVLKERTNWLVTGDKFESRYSYTTEKFLSQRDRILAASLGCGSGDHEIEWARQGVFDRIDAIDVSPARIELARTNARREGLDQVCHFKVGDFQSLAANTGEYDVVIFESSLHHFSPMEKVVEFTCKLLKPGGLVFLFDFVGPTKWQWLPGQLRLVNSMIELLPRRYKKLPNGRYLRKRFRPSLLRMHLMDPSEAAESARIIPCLRERFEEVEFKNAGGALLNHFIQKIQHNFDPENVEDMRWLDCLMAIEDLHLYDTEAIGMWYCFGVYRKPG